MELGVIVDGDKVTLVLDLTFASADLFFRLPLNDRSI